MHPTESPVSTEDLARRMADLERTLAPLTALAMQVEPALAGITDAVDEAAPGLDLDARARGALSLMGRLTDPATVARLHGALDALEAAPGLVALLADAVDEQVARQEGSGPPLHEVVRQGVRAGSNLVQSGILDDRTTRAVGQLGQALAASADQPAEPVGVMGLLSALRDPAVQRALGFLVSVGRTFGTTLPSSSN